MDTIGKRFKAWREDINISRKEINKIAGIPLSTLADIENDKTVPSGKTLIPLYNNFKVPITYILTGKENSTLSDDKKTLLTIYDKLNDLNKKLAISEIRHMSEVQELKESN